MRRSLRAEGTAHRPKGARGGALDRDVRLRERPSARQTDIGWPPTFAERGLEPYVVWEVVLLEPVEAWLMRIARDDPDTAKQVAAAFDLLRDRGPSLGRPFVDTLQGSSLANLKELRPGSRGRSELRLLFVFDPKRRAVVLVAGDKSTDWRGWYREAIRLAEHRYRAWLDEELDR